MCSYVRSRLVYFKVTYCSIRYHLDNSKSQYIYWRIWSTDAGWASPVFRFANHVIWRLENISNRTGIVLVHKWKPIKAVIQRIWKALLAVLSIGRWQMSVTQKDIVIVNISFSMLDTRSEITDCCGLAKQICSTAFTILKINRTCLPELAVMLCKNNNQQCLLVQY